MSAEALPLPTSRRPGDGLAWRCPQCQTPLQEVHPGYVACQRCDFVLEFANGIWRALPPSRMQYFRRFMTEYSAIRAAEGRGSQDSAYYLALPFLDLSGNNSQQWQIRSRTFSHFCRKILPEFERRAGKPLAILDLGAGNGWLSYRLSVRGHFCAAVDLLDNDQDGLAAATHYSDSLGSPLCCVQAEMDRLPFASAQFDIAIFNSSLHYSEDYVETISEAARCVKPGGHIVILDSPFYRDPNSGLQMAEERRRQFLDRYGFASDSIPSLEFLTQDLLDRVAWKLNFEWHVARPWYGWRWTARPWRARLLHRREPSKFHIYWAQVTV